MAVALPGMTLQPLYKWFHMSVRKDLCRFLHEPPPNDSGHPSSIDIESTDFEDNLQTELDFRPFSSRIDVMANLIVHSPRSMGELNLKFIFYTLRQLQLPFQMYH
eukprot:Em0003g33a